MPIPFSFDHFYQYDEILAFLKQAAGEYPGFADLSVVGKSYEGRDIWCITITNKATGPHNEKPAMYIDGNIHAGEVTGSHVAMYTIKQLLETYGTDPQVTHLLDTRTFYIIPRVNPDGAELYLTTPTMLRSSVRPYPEEEEKDGLRAEDMDGDGMILQMRVQDPSGPWKVSEKDARVMMLRSPDDMGGKYYRIYPEGRIHGDEERPVKIAPTKYGLDINRNFPANWVLSQGGAGPYPLSEPETRALAEFVLAHPNIGAFQAYHTTGGVIYRAFCSKPDDKMIPADLALFKAIGRRGEEILGYECMPASHGGLGAVRAGIFIDWVYEHRGIVGYTTELWDMMGRAGADKKKESSEKTPKEQEEDQIKQLKWQDENLGGKGFVNWTPFNHPQLGQVELGGWVPKTVRQNAPPGKFLEEECQKNYKFTNAHALATPLIAVEGVSVTKVAENVWKLGVFVKNDGYMGTYGTQIALQAKIVKPLKVSVCLGGAGEVVGGKAEQEIGHLDGRVAASAGWYGPGGTTNHEKKVEWTVRAPVGTKVTIEAVSERGGTKRAEVVLQ
ncbi:MAG: M14 family metallopeptidase [Bacillota bacterium]|nr:M14 family metallopeptidase [Bacillota bacterium]